MTPQVFVDWGPGEDIPREVCRHFNFVEPTLTVLEHFYVRVSRGGVILLDNYASEGDSGQSYHGDTYAVDKFFENKKVKINRFPFAARPSYIVKE